jgi:hypothetical protein
LRVYVQIQNGMNIGVAKMLGDNRALGRFAFNGRRIANENISLCKIFCP